MGSQTPDPRPHSSQHLAWMAALHQLVTRGAQLAPSQPAGRLHSHSHTLSPPLGCAPQPVLVPVLRLLVPVAPPYSWVGEGHPSYGFTSGFMLPRGGLSPGWGQGGQGTLQAESGPGRGEDHGAVRPHPACSCPDPPALPFPISTPCPSPSVSPRGGPTVVVGGWRAPLPSLQPAFLPGQLPSSSSSPHPGTSGLAG